MKVESILEAMLQNAAASPDKLCVADADVELTYREMESLSRRTATVLERLGIRAGDRVVVEARQRADYIALEFALHLLGAVFVPMENRCALEKLRGIARVCSASLIVTVNAAEDACEIPGQNYAQLAEASACAAEYHGALPHGGDISEILFSTGTTGKEKGIVLTHISAVAVAENIMFGSAMRFDNVELIPSPLNHSHGLRSFYANILCGGTVVLVDSVMDMRRFFGSMNKYTVNAIDLVPTALSIILKLSHDKLGEYASQLRYIEFGSAPMMDADRQTIIRLLPGVPLLNYYGSTESGRATVYNFNISAQKKGCIGKATHNTEIIIVDPDRHPIRSSAENTGLLASRGSMNMLGYYQDEQETQKVMDGGFIYSNDEAYLDDGGNIILLGRVGDVINVGGKKVAPEEIESAAKAHPDVLDCGCISVPDAMTGSAPKLLVELQPGRELDAKAIKTFISERLEPFKVPKYIETVKKIPRSYNGKLLRRELREQGEEKK